MKKVFLLVGALVFLMLPVVASADSIAPSTVSATIAVGGSVTIHKTVTISAGSPTTAQADILFLCDTTGSMFGTIGTVQSNLTTPVTGIIPSLTGIGNLQFGVAQYKDFPISPYGSPGDFAYQLDAPIGTAAAAQTAVNAWSASGGNDGPESNLYALQQAAGAATGWRPGSQKIIAWFGDAPGHDSALEPAYPGTSLAAATAALTGNSVKVLAFDVGALNSTGQATSITGATGGSLTSGLATAATIIAAIGSAFATYSTVDLETPVLAGLGFSVVPTSITGSFDRSIDRTFGFDLTITGLAPGTYTFDIFGRADGGRVATESDTITVTGAVPEPGTLLLLGSGLIGLLGLRRRLS